ncbi:MAG TPA: serine/threonine-protein kinase [Steroidobacteraceae bacterium]|nr:serine/threonine-protein kinase [Steroidobacteraceae bacterium]
MARERLASYPLLEVIGRGSMGILYKTLDPRSRRSLAIKVLPPELLAQEPDFLEQFRNEARVARSLSHPGIVSVYEYGEEQGCAYIVMEYVEGRSLQQHFEDKVAFEVATAVSLTSQLLEALQYAHEKGIWHRDVKPANILVARNGRTKVTDFGIAEVAVHESGATSRTVMGTPGYIAPETYLTDTFDARVDLFAAGALLYRLLTGEPAFEGTAQQIMVKVCYETPPPPSMRGNRPKLRPFDAVVLKALARRPEDRFASAHEFRDALVAAALPGIAAQEP